ncbi:hypothetical protein LZ554_002947 [Drepanopeziza brunnea f. sp. 'monogermtubi']|nr:hypothetical protein LZ554_002947 [Drepanopeziza brunnea f. sp. 'monogermtubi']
MLMLKMTTVQTTRATKTKWVKIDLEESYVPEPATAARPDGKRYAPYTGAKKEAGSLDPTLNKNPALPGTPDPSMYKFTISFDEVDPDVENKRIPAKTAAVACSAEDPP